MRCLEGRARQSISRTPLLAILVAMVLLGGCSTDDGNDPTPSAQSTITSTSPATAQPGELTPVVWTTAIDKSTNAPGARLETFARDEDVIYAVVRVSQMPAGSSLTATWAFNDAPLDAFTSSVSVVEDQAEGFIEFHLAWKGETYWPRGTLGINVTASTGQSTSSFIQVQ